MRFGLVHRVMTDALAALGVLALVTSGQFSRWVSAVTLVGLALAIALRDWIQRMPLLRRLDSIGVTLVFGGQVLRFLVFDANVLDLVVEFAAGLQVVRLATRKGAAHDQQVIVLALLHLIAGTVLGGGLGYGLCFLGVLVVAPGALVLSHLRREVEGNYRQGARDRTGLPVDVPRILKSRRVVGRSFLAVTCLLSIPIFVFTAVLFVLFPRVGLSLLLLNRGHSGRMIGFSGRVDLGEVGVLRTDPTLAMRVELPDLPAQPDARVTLHLRGTALDRYDGRAWSQSEAFQRSADPIGDNLIPIEPMRERAPLGGAVERGPDPAIDATWRIELEPIIDPPVLFLPSTATGFRIRPRGQLGGDALVSAFRGPEGELRYKPIDDRSLKYEVFVSRKGTPAFMRLAMTERARYLQVPPDMPDRIRDLTREWTAGATTARARAEAVLRRLTSEYRYDLASPSGRSKQPLDHFLFESKRGHCEFYSTAMAVMLRTLGIPTRNVTGFIGGTYNRFGRFYAVRQGDAHSWVEVFLDGEGWVTFDPTPAADALPKAELAGVWAYLRDLLEATSQRWDRHVVGYDLTQQYVLLQGLTSKYRRGGSSLPASWSRRRVALVAGSLLVVVGAGMWLVLRRRARAAVEHDEGSGRRSPSAAVATALYELLDAAMAAQGLTRPPSTPPLRHARTLAGLGHPLAAEIAELTDIYVEARFGGRRLSDEERRELERRVRAVRAFDLRSVRTQGPRELRAV